MTNSFLGSPRFKNAFRPRLEPLETLLLPSFAAPQAFPAGLGPHGLAAGELRPGSGLVDVVVANPGANIVSVLLRSSTGKFRSPVSYPVGAFPNDVALGDFDRDGDLDIACSNRDADSVSVLQNIGRGKFASALSIQVGDRPGRIAVGDFDLDDKLDILTPDEFGHTVSVLLGNGDGTFEGKISSPAGSFPGGMTIGEFNGDGILDVSVNRLTTSNSVRVLLGNGNGTFLLSSLSYNVEMPVNVSAGDINDDGCLDLLTANLDPDTVSILLGNCDGKFAQAVNVQVGSGSGPVEVVVADFGSPGGGDPDGINDFAVANADSKNVGVYYRIAGLSFEHSASDAYGIGASAVSLIGADFDHNGLVDLAVSAGNSVSVLINRRDGRSLGENAKVLGTLADSESLLDSQRLDAKRGMILNSGTRGIDEVLKDGAKPLVIQAKPRPICATALIGAFNWFVKVGDVKDNDGVVFEPVNS